MQLNNASKREKYMNHPTRKSISVINNVVDVKMEFSSASAVHAVEEVLT